MTMSCVCAFVLYMYAVQKRGEYIYIYKKSLIKRVLRTI